MLHAAEGAAIHVETSDAMTDGGGPASISESASAIVDVFIGTPASQPQAALRTGRMCMRARVRTV